MAIRFTTTTERPARVEADVLVIPVFAGGQLPEDLPTDERAALAKELRARKFKGEWGNSEVLLGVARLSAPLVAVIGLGEESASLARRAEGMRRGVGSVIKATAAHGITDLAVGLAGVPDAEHLAAASYEAAELASYVFETHKTAEGQRNRGLRQVIATTTTESERDVKRAVKQARSVLTGVALTRDLVNQPASAVTPLALVEQAREIVRESDAISLRVMDRAQAEKEDFGAFLAVARGSEEEPYVIHLTYRPETPSDTKLFLVGKGITFDSGGLDIKPAGKFKDMKTDMGGAATVLGLFATLQALKPNVEVHGVIATCENMPSGKAYRPGDVLTAKNGKTIEVMNTDAEGRVTLADALSYAVEEQADMIVDLATLTGASVVALGETYAGLWGNDGDLSKRVLGAAEEVGEGLVEFPLPDEYKQHIRGVVADVSNAPGNHPYGGATTAALFLQEFVSEVPWVHLDVAGPVFSESQSPLSYYGQGATGYGVRTLAALVQQFE